MMIYPVILAMLASGTTAPASRAADEVICKKFEVTGSLVKKRRVCHTRAEWAKINDRDQAAARQFVDDNRGRPPGN
jgi:hypothetical protein